MAELRGRLAETELPEEVRREVEKELQRLERLSVHAPDYQVTRTHIELVIDLPWEQATEDNLDLSRAREILDADHFDLKDVKDRIVEHLAVMKLNPEARRELSPGVAAGLAWTEAGGEVLYVESVLTRGEEKVLLTGQLGKVMQESARAARSYVLSHAQELGIDVERVQESGIHIHVPAGATPKDGRSHAVSKAPLPGPSRCRAFPSSFLIPISASSPARSIRASWPAFGRVFLPAHRWRPIPWASRSSSPRCGV